jgi:hypothetical protein
MVNFMDFIHMRSSSGMLRKARRLAVLIAHQFNKELDAEIKEVEKQISYANEKGSYDEINKLLDVYDFIENNLHKIFVFENLIIYEADKREMKSEEHFEKTFEGFFLLLPDESQKKLQLSVHIMEEMRSYAYDAIMKLRKLERDIEFERINYRFTQYFNISSTHAILSREMRLLIDERHLSVEEKSEEKNIDKILDSIHKILGKYKTIFEKYKQVLNALRSVNDIKKKKSLEKEKIKLFNELKKIIKNVNKLIDELYSHLTKLKVIFTKEFHLIKRICELFSIFRVRVMHELNHDVVKLLDGIKKEGFNGELHHKLENHRKELFDKLHHHSRHEEKMTLHEYNEHQRGVSVRLKDIKKGKAVSISNNEIDNVNKAA